ncbi:MAG: secondary thiamine-phosphate synthase enzyme YjbQ [Nitrososphaerota archaeon]
MKVITKNFTIESRKKIDFIDITNSVEDVLREVEVVEGLVTIFTPHTTTCLFINEDEKRLMDDLEKMLEKLVPIKGNYFHDNVDDNAYAHLRSILLSTSISIPVSNGRLLLGTWQNIFLAEFDGPRKRTYIIQVMGA